MRPLQRTDGEVYAQASATDFPTRGTPDRVRGGGAPCASVWSPRISIVREITGFSRAKRSLTGPLAMVTSRVKTCTCPARGFAVASASLVFRFIEGTAAV